MKNTVAKTNKKTSSSKIMHILKVLRLPILVTIGVIFFAVAFLYMTNNQFKSKYNALITVDARETCNVEATAIMVSEKTSYDECITSYTNAIYARKEALRVYNSNPGVLAINKITASYKIVDIEQQIKQYEKDIEAYNMYKKYVATFSNNEPVDASKIIIEDCLKQIPDDKLCNYQLATILINAQKYDAKIPTASNSAIRIMLDNAAGAKVDILANTNKPIPTSTDSLDIDGSLPVNPEILTGYAYSYVNEHNYESAKKIFEYKRKILTDVIDVLSKPNQSFAKRLTTEEVSKKLERYRESVAKATDAINSLISTIGGVDNSSDPASQNITANQRAISPNSSQSTSQCGQQLRESLEKEYKSNLSTEMTHYQARYNDLMNSYNLVISRDNSGSTTSILRRNEWNKQMEQNTNDHESANTQIYSNYMTKKREAGCI